MPMTERKRPANNLLGRDVLVREMTQIVGDRKAELVNRIVRALNSDRVDKPVSSWVADLRAYRDFRSHEAAATQEERDEITPVALKLHQGLGAEGVSLVMELLQQKELKPVKDEVR